MKLIKMNHGLRNLFFVAILVPFIFDLSSFANKMSFQTSSVVPSAEESVKGTSKNSLFSFRFFSVIFFCDFSCIDIPLFHNFFIFLLVLLAFLITRHTYPISLNNLNFTKHVIRQIHQSNNAFGPGHTYTSNITPIHTIFYKSKNMFYPYSCFRFFVVACYLLFG